MSDESLPAVRDYHIYFSDARELEVRDKSGDLNFTDKIYSGAVSVYDFDGKIVPVTKQNTKAIVPFVASICAHCLEKLAIHPGETFCPKCEKFTWLSATEH
jgi:hypothetical protein